MGITITTRRIELAAGNIDWQTNFVEHEEQVHLDSLRAEVEGHKVFAVFETDDERILTGDTELTIFNLALLNEDELERFHDDYPAEMMPENREVPVEVNGERYTLIGILQED